MRTVTSGLAAAVLLAGAGLGLASAASADQVLEGIYTYTEEGQPSATWTISPSCVPVVGDLREPLYLPVACRLHVTSSTSSKINHTLETLNYSSDAILTGGRWTATITKPEGVLCPDGSTDKSIETYAFDDASLTGTHTVTHSTVCGLPPAVIKTPFTLSYQGPLPMPVERYPLDCEPGGLRLCT